MPSCLLLLALFGYSTQLEVALFPSTGCYSHDVMMKQIGQGFDQSSANITWIQSFLYDFGFGEMKLPETWRRISENRVDQAGASLMQAAGSLLWEQNVPTDFDRPWDLRGTVSFFKMLERHQTFCEKMLVNRNFIHYMKTGKADVVILDHFLQECVGGLSHLLNSSVVQFSNWPIADGYITSLNVPANPSSIPKTGTPFSGLGMPFGHRVGNYLFHNVIILTRYIQIYVLDNLFERHGYPEVSIIRSEAERIIYAGRSEFLFDVTRPINNRVKHFGAANCLEPSDYVMDLPSMDSSIDNSASFDDEIPTSAYLSARMLKEHNRTDGCLESCLSKARRLEPKNQSDHLKYRSHIYEGVTLTQAEARFSSVQSQFPALDWKRLSTERFVLVSFGSVAQVHNMPVRLLRLLLATFALTDNTVIWQTNSPVRPLLEENNITLPDNVLLIDWAPVKELLAHPNLQYIICHGGINTVNELMLFGVPVIGVPLQGDQGSNLRRLADLGAAEVVSTVRLAKGHLIEAMRKMENNLESYWKRSSHLASMLRFYRKMHANDQNFWIRMRISSWTARNGPKLRGRSIFRLEYIGDSENQFWFGVLSIISLALIICAN